MALKKNGERFPVLIYSNPYDNDGEIAGLRGIIVDITEQKQADDAVKQSEKKFRSYIDNAPDGICLFDHSGSIRETNPAFCRMTGYPSADLEHLNFKNLIPRDDLSVIDNFFEALVEDGVATCDIGFVHKDGTRGQWVLDAVRIDDEKSMVFIKDITDRKNLEEQFRQAQKMEAIGQLAGGVAHDFNNLLTVISGYSSLILGNDELCPQIKDKIEQIKKAGDRAESLTRQLLAFSRKQIAQPEVLNVNTIIKDSHKMFNRLIGEDIKIELKLAEEIPYIMADPHQLEQILINLVVNARDAIQSQTDPDNKKQIIIETTESHIDEQNIECVRINIKDTGTGMDRQTRNKIFDPFFTTKGLGKGTGLGLSTVYGIVKQNNADIKVQSEPGNGATFSVYWPSVEVDAEDIRDSENPEVMKSGDEMILLVEDDDAVRGFAEETLKTIGYQVVTAEDGEDALTILAKNNLQPDLLVTDLIMPGLNGKELAERVEQVYPTLKVIFTSGYTDNKIMQDGFLEKGVHFVQKPYSVSMLTSKIREVLDQ